MTSAKRRFFANRNGDALEEKSFASLQVEAVTTGEDNKAAAERGINQYKMFLDLYYAGLRVLRTNATTTI